MSIKSYAIWNNKGGVGKSTITFHLATRYAELHPNAIVVVIDMCPQANASMMLLGGGNQGETAVLQLCQTTPMPQTVVGYVATVLSGGSGAPRPSWHDYAVTPTNINQNIPKNIVLISGDGNLEPMAPLISSRAAQAALVPNQSPWKWVHEVLKRLIEDVHTELASDVVVFVDTNPSFSIYTEMAISTVEHLLVPVNADDASRVATAAMFTLIWGTNPPHPVYGQYTFANYAQTTQLSRPVVHLVIGNRLTQHVGAAGAFGAISDYTVEELFAAYQANAGRFTPRIIPSTTKADFIANYSAHLRDFNTAGVVAAHTGTPLSKLKGGDYTVYNKIIQVNAKYVADCKNAVDSIVQRL